MSLRKVPCDERDVFVAIKRDNGSVFKIHGYSEITSLTIKADFVTLDLAFFR